ncbi:MAG: GumC family protein [Alphaproteobacteria bacterium]
MAITDDVKGPRDYLAAVLRRKFRLIVPAVIIVAIAIVVAVVTPAVYRSTGTVLIEEPEVPREFIRSTITSFAAERLQIIQQRVMTTQNLISIINKFNLYAEQRKTTAINEIARGFRDKIAMQLVSAEVVDPRSGQARKAVIAFNLSFEDSDRRVAQQVANELVSLYLNENLRIRREKAAETTGFLAEEGDRLGKQLGELEARIAEFKARHSGVLPEQLGINQAALARTDAQLTDANRRLQLLEERRIVLQSELSQLNPMGTRVVDGQTILSPPERLKALQTKLISMRGVYGAQHPDVEKMRREIEVLKKETGGGVGADAYKQQLQEVNDLLAEQRKKYGNKHPDVVKLERQAQSLRAEIKEGKSGGGSSLAPKPDNPNYIMVQGQIRTLDSQVDAINREREALKAALKHYEERVLKIPENEREYLTLRRDYDNAQTKYRDVRAKQLEAQLAEALETERKGERFSLIEPPQLPLDPIRPNRMAIIFIGLVFAGAAGVGNVFLAEALDESIHGAKSLRAITGQAPLVVVPVIGESIKKPSKWPWILLGATVLLICLIGAIFAYHTYVRPLDVLWFSTLRKLGLG